MPRGCLADKRSVGRSRAILERLASSNYFSFLHIFFIQSLRNLSIRLYYQGLKRFRNLNRNTFYINNLSRRASKAMKAFPELPPIRRCHDYEIKTKFTYRCVGCGYSVGRHSKSLDVEKKRCGHCYGKFELLINKITKSGTVEVKTPTTKKPTAFALFVKENYHSVKKERKGVAHKEVMQILGQQFSAIKISKKNGNSDDNNSDGASKV